MLQHLAGSLRGAAGARPEALLRAAPALSRQARCFGFGSHMSDNDPEVMEKEKQRHLQGKTISHIKQVPGWSEKLASDAEAVVKAEKECADCSMEEMQQQTLETLKAKEEEEADSPSHQGIIQEPRSGAMGA